MSVVEFPTPDRLIWVCGCGCATFELDDDGLASCAICGENPSCDDGAWYESIKDGARRPEDAEAPTYEISGNGSVEFARRRTEQIASAPDAVAVVVVMADGMIHTWSSVDTAERTEWLGRRLKDAFGAIAANAKRHYESEL